MALTWLSQHGLCLNDIQTVRKPLSPFPHSLSIIKGVVAIRRRRSNRIWRPNRHNSQSPVSASLWRRKWKLKVCTRLCFLISKPWELGFLCAHAYCILTFKEVLHSDTYVWYQTIHLLLGKLLFPNLIWMLTDFLLSSSLQALFT